jgi:hypothetical protein
VEKYRWNEILGKIDCFKLKINERREMIFFYFVINCYNERNFVRKFLKCIAFLIRKNETQTSICHLCSKDDIRIRVHRSLSLFHFPFKFVDTLCSHEGVKAFKEKLKLAVSKAILNIKFLFGHVVCKN